MDKQPVPEVSSITLIKRLLNTIGLLKSPDTHEDLEQEIQELLEGGEEQGLISAQEGMMINSIFELRDTQAREVMTPRAEMVCAPATASVAEIIDLITDHGFTRIPIYTESLDNITGILHAKDLLSYGMPTVPVCDHDHVRSSTKELPPGAADLANPPLFIMENHKIGKLLRDFKDKKIHLAIVTDEFGATRGLITLEDILEEIVGEISDESDKEEMSWRVVDDKTVLSDAKVDVEEVESFFNIHLPEGTYESIGGLVIHQLGRLPERGEQVVVKGLRIQVMAADQRRISTLKITRLAGS